MRLICWLRELWSILTDSYWDFSINDIVYTSGHFFVEQDDGSYACEPCGSKIRTAKIGS